MILTNNSSTERDTKAEKPKADKPNADKSAAKKPEDDDDDEPKPKYASKPGDKADVNDYKNSNFFKALKTFFSKFFHFQSAKPILARNSN